MNDTRPTIHERMIAILGDLPAIGKNQRNEQQRFMFRGHDDVLNALNPLLSKHGVFVVPNVLERITDQRQTRSGNTMFEVNLRVEFTFYGERGDSVACSTWGEGTDSGDKATNKAMTMAFKNALNQSFAISTEETKDTDGETPPASTGRTSVQPERAASPRPAQSTGEVRVDAPGPEPVAADAAPSPVASPEETKKAWIADWDSHTLAQINNAIPKMTADECREALVMEGEREMRGKGKPRNKTVTVALRDRIRTLEGSDGEPEAVAPVSQATTEGAAAPSDSEPGSPSVSPVLLVKAALAWIADQPQDVANASAWTTTGVLLGLSEPHIPDAHRGTFATLEEVPAETLLWIFDEAIPDPVRDGVRRLGPEALSALAAQAK